MGYNLLSQLVVTVRASLDLVRHYPLRLLAHAIKQRKSRRVAGICSFLCKSRRDVSVSVKEIVPGRLWQFAYDGGASNATVVKGRDGSLLVLQAPPRTPAVEQCLSQLGGPLKYVMVPDSAHNKHVFAWEDAATLIVPQQDYDAMEKHGLLQGGTNSSVICFDRDEAFASIRQNYWLSFSSFEEGTCVWGMYEFHFHFDGEPKDRT